MAAPSNQAIFKQIIINFIPAKRHADAQTSRPGTTATEPLKCLRSHEILLTMPVVLWVGSDVLEDEGASCSHNQDLQHEVVESLKEDGAETLRLEGRTVVVAKEGRSIAKRIRGQPGVDIDFKLVTDAIDTYRRGTRSVC